MPKIVFLTMSTAPKEPSPTQDSSFVGHVPASFVGTPGWARGWATDTTLLTWPDHDAIQAISHAVPLDFPRTCRRNQTEKSQAGGLGWDSGHRIPSRAGVTTPTPECQTTAGAGGLGATVTGIDRHKVHENGQLNEVRNAPPVHLVVLLPEQLMALDDLERITDLSGGRDRTIRDVPFGRIYPAHSSAT